jgi:hypothetical protein
MKNKPSVIIISRMSLSPSLSSSLSLSYTIFISIFHCEILLGLLSLYLMTELSKDILSWLSPKANSSSERGTLPGFLERKWKRVFRHPGAFPTQCTQIYTSSEQPNLMEIHTF